MSLQPTSIRTPDILTAFINANDIQFDDISVPRYVNAVIALAVKNIFDSIDGIVNEDIENILIATDINILTPQMHSEMFTLTVTLIQIFSEELSSRNLLYKGVYYVPLVNDYHIILECM